MTGLIMAVLLAVAPGPSAHELHAAHLAHLAHVKRHGVIRITPHCSPAHLGTGRCAL